ncbi:Gfo/Idh/MocA family protein [Neobacillus sp. NPDC093127]|uniref:Gfo/Idh/MocA family protein n=1 Tax=Neobacillus sp. NPDC093127 TaxID=3364296 RepID=UPI0038225A5C
MKLKVGMIGAGGVAKRAHMNALNALKEFIEVISVSDVNIEAAKTLAEAVGAARIYSNYHELLSIKEIDAVVVTTPNFLHSTISIDALKAGKHVLCEKPLAINPVEAKKMIETAKGQGKILMTALNNRFRDEVAVIKNDILQNKLGDIYHAKCGWVRRSGIPGWGGWFTNKSLSGGGPLIDLGVHMLDLTLYLMGDPKVVSVSAATYQKFGHKGTTRARAVANPNGIYDVEDYVTAFIRLENGATINLDTSWASNIEKEKVFVQLLGDKAGVDLTNGNPLTYFTEEDGKEVNYQPNSSFVDSNAHKNMWKHFYESIINQTAPLPSGERGLQINQILDAIYTSSLTKHEVYL